MAQNSRVLCEKWGNESSQSDDRCSRPVREVTSARDEEHFSIRVGFASPPVFCLLCTMYHATFLSFCLSSLASCDGCSKLEEDLASKDRVKELNGVQNTKVVQVSSTYRAGTWWGYWGRRRCSICLRLASTWGGARSASPFIDCPSVSFFSALVDIAPFPALA